MIEKYRLRPTINVTEVSQIKVITIKTSVNKQQLYKSKQSIVKTVEILQICRIIVPLVFVTIITITKMVIQEMINNHRTIPIPAEMGHMMKSIQNKIVSGTIKKLQNSIMSKKKAIQQ